MPAHRLEIRARAVKFREQNHIGHARVVGQRMFLEDVGVGAFEQSSKSATIIVVARFNPSRRQQQDLRHWIAHVASRHWPLQPGYAHQSASITAIRNFQDRLDPANAGMKNVRRKKNVHSMLGRPNRPAKKSRTPCQRPRTEKAKLSFGPRTERRAVFTRINMARNQAHTRPQ
jgi:hypothetical protein